MAGWLDAVSWGVRGGLGSKCGHLKQKGERAKQGTYVCLEYKAIGTVVPGCPDSGLGFGPQIGAFEAGKQTPEQRMAPWV